MTESATTVVRGEAGLEQPVMQMMQRTAEALGRTGRDNTGISDGGNLSGACTIQTDVSSTRDSS